MTRSCQRPCYNRGNERGVVLVMVSICMFMLIGLLALAIDIGRLFIVLRQVQNAADTAALSGVEALMKETLLPDTDPNYYKSTPISGWLQVKPRVRFVLQNSPVFGAQIIDSGFAFNEGGSCYLDSAPFSGTIGRTSSTGNGKLILQVQRGIVCYNTNESIQRWRQVDFDNNKACLANAVQATVTVETIPFYFAQIFGATAKDSITRTARAHTRKPNSCSFPNCSYYFQAGYYDTNLSDGGALVNCP